MNLLINNDKKRERGSSRTNMMKIMILDDEEDISLLFKEGLEIIGSFDVIVFNDPIKALYDHKSNTYDLILIDIIMPKMNGIEFYANLKKIEKETETKICFFSAGEYSEEKIRDMFTNLKHQKTILIRKPIRIKELLIKIDEIINEKIGI
jgi:DNA-binding response OmpR family regulator